MATIKQRIDNVTDDVTQGKTDIANAITEKGVPTSSGDSFHVMAENIKLIPAKELITITGVVTDDCENYLVDATVTEVGTTNSVKTDGDGRYTISANPNGKLEFSTKSYHTSIIDINNRNEINLVMWYEYKFNISLNNGDPLPSGYIYYDYSSQVGSLTEEDAKIIGMLIINDCPNPDVPFNLKIEANAGDTMSLVKSDFFNVSENNYNSGYLEIENYRIKSSGADFNCEKIGYLLLKVTFYDCESSPEYYYKVKIALKPKVGAPIIDDNSFSYNGNNVTFTVISPTFDTLKYWLGYVDDNYNPHDPDYTTGGYTVTNNEITVSSATATGTPIGIMAIKDGMLSPCIETSV